MTGRIYGRPARPGGAPATATGYLTACLAVFLACMQYWTWHEVLEPGRQYADPLLPCALISILGTAITMGTWRAVAGLYRRVRVRRACQALYTARAQSAGRPSKALPMLIAEHHDAPGRIVWKPDDGAFDAEEIDHVARLAFDHDVMAVVVSMKPAAEQAARILLAQAWQRLCQQRRIRKPCPVVLPMRAQATTTATTTTTTTTATTATTARPMPRAVPQPTPHGTPRAVDRSPDRELTRTTVIAMPVKARPEPPITPA